MRSLHLLGAMALLSACSAAPPAEQEQRAAAPVRTITTGTVEMRPVGGEMAASGLLVVRDEVTVSPQVAGYRVTRVLVDEGATVTAGQALVRLDPALLQARLAQARAAVQEAEARANQAAGEAGRVSDLAGTGVLSDEQIATRRYQNDSARASVAVARAQLRDVQVQLAELTIRAPAGGVVLQRTVRPGDVAAPGGEPMFRIARDRRIELDAELPEDLLDSVGQGTIVRVTLPAGGVLDGRVRFVSPRVDPQSKLGRVRISLPVDTRLRPGGFARASIARQAAPVRAVPAAAVQFEASGPLVVTIGQDGRARRVPVRTGARADGWVALIDGPPAGTRVALGSGAFLLDGDRVRIARPVSSRGADQ